MGHGLRCVLGEENTVRTVIRITGAGKAGDFGARKAGDLLPEKVGWKKL